MAKPSVPAKPEGKISPPPVFRPDPVTRDDFFRLMRVGNCWQVEMVRVSGEKVVFRRPVYAEDIRPNTEKKLSLYASMAEARR